ncbi:hypothetical protein CR513_08457, partial [Mucuna pruriens]
MISRESPASGVRECCECGGVSRNQAQHQHQHQQSNHFKHSKCLQFDGSKQSSSTSTTILYKNVMTQREAFVNGRSEGFKVSEK